MECRKHYATFIEEHPVDDGTDFKAYILDLHNNINKKKGKKEYSLQDVETYFHHFNSNKKNKNIHCQGNYRRGIEIIAALFLGFAITVFVLLIYRALNVHVRQNKI